jgi:hypothetical protein
MKADHSSPYKVPVFGIASYVKLKEKRPYW